MPRRLVFFWIAALIATAIFVRLGFWQISRLHERRAYNAKVLRGLDAAPVDAFALPNDTTVAYRRASVTGVPDYAHELTVINRSDDGSPGVWIVTPVRVAGHDSAVLVNRGWVYSPDGTTIDYSRSREGDTSATWSGFALNFENGSGPAILRKSPLLLRRIDSTTVANTLPYPVLQFVLIASPADTNPKRIVPRDPRSHTPTRLKPLPLDDGPHLSYAIQWFCFALIALVGTGFATARSMQRDESHLS